MPVDRPAWLGRAKADLDAALGHDPAARSAWEVALLYPGVHAIWGHRVSHELWRRDRRFAARALSQAVRWATGIEIHPGATVGERVFIDHGAGVVIGETAEVGDDVLIYHGVTLGGTTLDKGKRHPTVGDRVVIGAGAKILGAITVGDDSKVGANAVLVRSVGHGAVVVGVPGQVIARSEHASQERDAAAGPVAPDPVGATVQSLLTRVSHLERATGAKPPAAAPFSSTGSDWTWEDDLDFVI
jgi:serine O-acetyltransferase